LESLKRKKDFRSLAAGGHKLRPAPWLIINYSLNDQELLRWGWTAGGKIGSAVLRNRMRRWCREFFKTKKGFGVDINLVFLKQKSPEFYKELRHDELDRILEKAWNHIVQRSR
jgi:ribonuclease P protein component